MLLDLITLGVLAAELEAALRGRRIEAADADELGFTLAAHGSGDAVLRVDFGPPGALRLIRTRPRTKDVARSLRYLIGARVESVHRRAEDRVLEMRLSRHDADGELTYGVLFVELIPPRFRLALVGERHGRILGAWAAVGDRRAQRAGASYTPPVTGSRRLPADMVLDDWERVLAAHDTLTEALRSAVIGADRHVSSRICADAGYSLETPLADDVRAVAERLCDVTRTLYAGPHGHAYRWDAGDGRWRVSVLGPLAHGGTLESYASVSEALQAPILEDRSDTRGRSQRRRLGQALTVLRRRAEALQADLDEARDADAMERAGNSLLAAADAATRGPGRAEVPDVHDPTGSATIVVELPPGQTATEHAARLLKRSRRFRRRLDLLPPRLHRVREQVVQTEALLSRFEDPQVEHLPEGDMEHWERRVELASKEERSGAKHREARSEAHPRRYRTSADWSVWAGRNNRENDLLTHKMAAQNDIWFHAHGYAGSHVILRREGRKEEPSRSSLEEAAAVAAYWSKGRTASKVAVVYTLAKYVSKPRDGAPGLAVMKREKTLMVQPQLLPTDDEAS